MLTDGAAAPSEDPRNWPTGRLVSTLARRVEHEWNIHLSAWGLTHSSLPVLASLVRSSHSQRGLAVALGVTEQTVSRLVRRLERIGYVTVHPSQTDRRRTVVELSELGRSALAEAAGSTSAEFIVTEGLEPPEVDEFRRLLVKIVLSEPRQGE